MNAPWGIPHSQMVAPGTAPHYPPPPAYTPVVVRQTFTTGPYAMGQQVSPTQPQPITVEPMEPKKKIDWPQPVRDYVQRSFDPCNVLPDVPRHEMEAKLKHTISVATDSNSLDTIDWANIPLPQQMIRLEKVQAAPAWIQESVNVHINGNGQINPAREHLISKKRTSQDLDRDDNESVSTPPWRNTNNRNGFEDRITYPANRIDKRQQPFQDDASKGTSKFQKNLEKRQRRFDGGYKSTYKVSPEPAATGPVVGTSQTLEKRYFRLTAPPIPSQVRPDPILRQTLELLKKKWKKEGNYSYICDQFKSMRQDLTVQRIKNEFTVTVYEIHGRIALEKGDIGEYNQCQTQLKALYDQKVGGNPVEFKAYRILYFIHTSNRTALNDVLADLTTAEKEEKAIKHALNVRSALALGNYHRFFRLYLDTPNMGAYLMDMFVVRERLSALSNMCKAYKPDVKLRFVTEELGFESDGDAAQFIYDYNGQHLLEEKEDGLRFLTGKAGQTFESAKIQAFKKVDIKGQI
ncbi:SAC3/GANP/Nin1/mts3/eIF-3 p25 family-domain-containing protein [Amylocarpus encephaloides]|uniref:SAC3/GANP/Nin1/mts3/eIF-3 p25 family-domain-containing protein n=1 Tax=Amylocarpus encephaloides TaxID=45428 RepID=A0A9P7YRM3_9HELO|nr:SAC3/GANP/Nin1/mts3/eIF-3 p25 family-domain-containing protein [Amylocarpus encephaloides]